MYVHQETCESCNMSNLALINIELSENKHESQCRPINVITVTANICCIASAQLFNLHIFTFSASTTTYTIFPIKCNNGMRDMTEPSLETFEKGFCNLRLDESSKCYCGRKGNSCRSSNLTVNHVGWLWHIADVISYCKP